MHAVVLLKLKPPYTTDLMHSFKDIDAISEASLIHGPYDCMIKLAADRIESLNEIVGKIREMKGVEDTMSCLVVHSWMR